MIGPGKFLIVFASGKNRRVAGKELHTDFGLNRDGAYLALMGPDGQTVIHEFVEYEFGNNKFGYPPQAKNVSYGLIQGKPFYLATPSPLAANKDSFPGFVEQPRMSVEHGLFDQPFSVSDDGYAGRDDQVHDGLFGSFDEQRHDLCTGDIPYDQQDHLPSDGGLQGGISGVAHCLPDLHLSQRHLGAIVQPRGISVGVGLRDGFAGCLGQPGHDSQ